MLSDNTDNKIVALPEIIKCYLHINIQGMFSSMKKTPEKPWHIVAQKLTSSTDNL